MSVYYNDSDPDVCAWLRELIKRGLLPDGEVDERSILDVRPDDLSGFRQCHFFAGVGGWAYALRLASVPLGWHVWTGSPPCQPFSAAGKGLGADDDRHLAPHFAGLVGACRPDLLFGEQVASSAVFGKAASGARRAPQGAPEWAWLDDLQDRLEAARYAVGASDIPAAGVGAFHIRQRTFFGAVADAARRGRGVVGDALEPGPGGHADSGGDAPVRLADAEGKRCGKEGDGSRRPAQRIGDGVQPERLDHATRSSTDHAGWDNADWLFCRDGKWRPVEPGTFPLAHGLPARVVRLRGYGNAICPQAAAEFVEAFLDALDDLTPEPRPASLAWPAGNLAGRSADRPALSGCGA